MPGTPMSRDNYGRLQSESTTYSGQTYGVSYGYNSKSQNTSITYPSGKVVAKSFDVRSQLDTLAWDATQLEDRGYNAIGALTSVDRPQVDETRTYDDLHRLTGINNTGSIEDASYTYDDNNNVTAESFTGVMANYGFSTGTSGYDNQDRFTRWIRSGTSTDYDLTRSAIGNISNVNLNGTNTARGYDNAHAVNLIGAVSQSFDTDGNATLLQSGVSVDWDEAGMVKSTSVPSGASAGEEGLNEYGYDAEGKRTWKKITRSGSVFEHKVFVYSGPNCVAEYNAGAAAASPAQEYVYADTIDSLVLIIRSDGQKLGVIRNRQWSITALYDTSTGTVVERYAYTPFGHRTIYAPNGTTVRTASSYNNPYGYTSRRHDDESGLMYFRARYYDRVTGEFTSRDPLEFVDGMSLYRAYFVPNNVDPWGLVSGDCDKSVGISFSNDWKTGSASAYVYWGTDCHVKLDPRKPDWDGALQKLKSCLGDCCINSIVFTSHGHPGGFGPLDSGTVTDNKSDENKFLSGLKDLLCEDNGGCRINACNVAKHAAGKKFICDMAETLGTNVIAWDDWYAVVPHGKEFTGCPDGTFDETGDTCREFEGSWVQWLNGGGSKPKTGNGKPSDKNGKTGKGGKEGCCKVNQKGCCGLKDGQGKGGNKSPKNK